jgi:predicted secreted Zn-dependent protease
MNKPRPRALRAAPLAVLLACTLFLPAIAAAPAQAAAPVPIVAAGAASLESAAAKAGATGRKVAMSMIALGFAIASIVLAFRRDFKEAAGVFAIGIVAILLATPTGVNVLHDTVNTLFGG